MPTAAGHAPERAAGAAGPSDLEASHGPVESNSRAAAPAEAQQAAVAEEEQAPENPKSLQTIGTKSSSVNERSFSSWNEVSSQWRKQIQERCKDRDGWSRSRLATARILEANFAHTESNIFDTFMGIIIFYNVFVMVVDTDAIADCDSGMDCTPRWVSVSNNVLMAIYTVEVCMRLYVHHWGFFCVSWNLLDFFIVFMGYIDMLLQALQEGASLKRVTMLRILRILKVLRVAKVLNRFPTLSSMIAGFGGAMSAMFWGLLLIGILLTFWSILAVEIIHPINKQIVGNEDGWCAEAFSSVPNATLLFFQTLVAGDSWGSCIIPVVLREPATSIVFVLALVSVQIGFMNLILAVIVDRSAEVRAASAAGELELKHKENDKHLERWREMIVGWDTDGNGKMSLDEVVEGYRDPTVRALMDSMNLGEHELTQIFHLLDFDGSGLVEYGELLGIFTQAQRQDMPPYLLIMKMQVQRMEKRMAMAMDLQSQTARSLQDVTRQLSTLESLQGEQKATRKPALMAAAAAEAKKTPQPQG